MKYINGIVWNLPSCIEFTSAPPWPPRRMGFSLTCFLIWVIKKTFSVIKTFSSTNLYHLSHLVVAVWTVHHVIGWWGAFLSLALNLFLSSAPYTFWVRLSMHFWARLSMHFWARLSMHFWARSCSEHGHFLSRASSGIRTVVFINRNVTLKFNVYLTNKHWCVLRQINIDLSSTPWHILAIVGCSQGKVWQG